MAGCSAIRPRSKHISCSADRLRRDRLKSSGYAHYTDEGVRGRNRLTIQLKLQA